MKMIWVAGLYFAVISAVTFSAYAKDKYAAMNNRWRVEERSLHMLAVLGGWPAAMLSQRVLHHKSRKRSFQRAFMLTIVLNCAVVSGILVAIPH